MSARVSLQEAATSWEKRQARIRARREGAKRGWMPWGGQEAATASAYSGTNGASAATGGRAQEAAAATAASARR